MFDSSGLRRVFLTVALLAFAFQVSLAEAQRPRISLVRDAEIEALVSDYARPLLRAAGLRRGAVSIHLINDPQLNAFVSGRGIYLNTGLILQTDDPGEVIGVIAHEIGHIVGGHQIRLRERLDIAKRVSTITSILGVGAGLAAGSAGSRSGAAAGLAVAQSAPSVALRSILKYQRGEEAAADRTAATLLRKTKQSGQGMLRTFQRLSEKLSLIGGQIDPYTISHPLPNERLSAMKSVLTGSPYFNRQSSKNLRLRHDMARAKIAAYTAGGTYARALLSGKDLHPTARLYGRAIVAHLYGSPKRALPMIDKLLKSQPRNAYLHEMKGEILLRSGKAKQAVPPFRRAIKYDRAKAGFLRVQLGHALVQSGTKAATKEAITQLRKGLTSDPTAVAGYQYLAMAYASQGREADALLASAEFSARTGQRQQARIYAKRAQASFKRGSPPWLRAEDIITTK